MSLSADEYQIKWKQNEVRMIEVRWNWVGRIRNKIKYYRDQTGRWCFTDSLYKQATR